MKLRISNIVAAFAFAFALFLVFSLIYVLIPNKLDAALNSLTILSTILVFFVLIIILTKIGRKSSNTLINEPFFITAISLIAVWILIQGVVAVSVELDYVDVRDEYLSNYSSALLEMDEVNATWDLVETYNKGYTNTYGENSDTNPYRNVFNNPSVRISLVKINPLLGYYFFEYNFNFCNLFQGDNPFFTIKEKDAISKFIISQKLGACGEFARSIALLVTDVTGYETRIVECQGVDHAIPEVKIDGTWWVLDRTYTTQQNPVQVEEYSEYLRMLYEEHNWTIYSNLVNMEDIENGKSLFESHGFESTILKVNVSVKATNSDEERPVPASGISVEIYYLGNNNDPLVGSNVTDDQGYAWFTLRPEKEYIILAETDKYVNITEISVPNEAIIEQPIYLKKNS